MKITKYEHSCLDIEIDRKRLLIDPSSLAKSIPNYDNVIAVVVTHVHADHFDNDKLKAIYAQNTTVKLFTVQAVSNVLKDSIPHVVVTGGQTEKIGPFKLDFAGGQHAIIYKSYPPTDNVGVSVNDLLYYPGDSFSKPDKHIDILGAPISAPWMKSADVMDFIIELKPKRVFQVHDELLSNFGISVQGARIQDACDMIGAKYSYLNIGQSIQT